eukprot:TRINITY_DN8203_c0_g1_i2.p1 TRINITY_DN8203_c0_g1~~TRINITY_DN8203_c0_g1_i2.p1  ORF type:complete len:279 (-),score=15.63 TRINITY_DN8203_c0_g1_i2:204-1040(-)
MIFKRKKFPNSRSQSSQQTKENLAESESYNKTQNFINNVAVSSQNSVQSTQEENDQEVDGRQSKEFTYSQDLPVDKNEYNMQLEGMMEQLNQTYKQKLYEKDKQILQIKEWLDAAQDQLISYQIQINEKDQVNQNLVNKLELVEKRNAELEEQLNEQPSEGSHFKNHNKNRTQTEQNKSLQEDKNRQLIKFKEQMRLIQTQLTNTQQQLKFSNNEKDQLIKQMDCLHRDLQYFRNQGKIQNRLSQSFTSKGKKKNGIEEGENVPQWKTTYQLNFREKE